MSVFLRFRPFILAALGLAAALPALASEPVGRLVGGRVSVGGAVVGGGGGLYETGPMRRLPLTVGKSVIIDLPRDAKDVIIADPSVANALVRSARKAFIVGVKDGQTSVYFLDEAGNQIMSYDVEVGRDMAQIRHVIRQMAPGARVNAELVGGSVVLTGEVASNIEAQQVVDAVVKMGLKPENVVNGLTIRGRDQVHLKVTVAEINRTAAKSLGIQLNKLGSGDGVNISSIAQLTLSGLDAQLQALQSNSLLRTLAEPTLTAISGESAKFLAGGEIPILTSYDRMSGTPTYTYKPYGVGLYFTPVVLSDGRISLKVNTEVSEIGAIAPGTNYPEIKVRRADTTIELPTGGTMVIAGMLRETSAQTIKGAPGLLNLPVLGTLFRSRAYNNNQTELVVMVTPYLVKPVSRNDLARPDDNLSDASDPAGMLLGRFNRIYGTSGPASGRQFHGTFGFIRD